MHSMRGYKNVFRDPGREGDRGIINYNLRNLIKNRINIHFRFNPGIFIPKSKCNQKHELNFICMTKTELRASFVCHYISTTDIEILIDLENALLNL